MVELLAPPWKRVGHHLPLSAITDPFEFSDSAPPQIIGPGTSHHRLSIMSTLAEILDPSRNIQSFFWNIPVDFLE